MFFELRFYSLFLPRCWVRSRPYLKTVRSIVKGEDMLGLSRGVSFNQLELSQSNNNTLIKVNGIALASLIGVNASLIGVNDFRTV